MKKLKIEIKRGDNGNLWAICDGWLSLFEFDYRVDIGWCFWLLGNRPSRIERGNFPMQYFIDACKATYFFNNGELPTDVEISKGSELLIN